MGKFLNVTPQAAVHLGRDYLENLRFTKNPLLKSVKQLVQVTEKLIKDQTETSGLTSIDCEEPTWRSTTPLCDKAIEITNAKTCVFTDSVPCLESIIDQPAEAWKNKIKWHLEKSLSQRSESNWWRADGARVENVPRIHYVGHSRRDSKNYDCITLWTWAVQRNDHLHVNVQRHGMGRTSELRSQILARTLVIFGTWIREEMVRNLLW